MQEIKVGAQAPDFTLAKSTKEKVSLKEMLGKEAIVLVFYPGDFSSVCTNEWCTFRDSLKDFEGLKARVVGISGDSVFVHDAFKKANNLNFELLSDYDHSVSRQYGVMYEEFLGMKGTSKRAVFIIDRNGIVRYRWVTEDASKLPNMEEIKKEQGRIA